MDALEFARVLVEHRQLRHLSLKRLGNLIRHAQTLGLLAELLDELVLAVCLVVAELLLDRPHLLTKDHLLLALVEPLLHLTMDLVPDLNVVKLLLHDEKDGAEPRSEIGRVKNGLSVGVGRVRGQAGDNVELVGQLAMEEISPARGMRKLEDCALDVLRRLAGPVLEVLNIK